MHGLVIQLKNVDFMQKMSCSLPSLEAIHAPRFMRGFMQNTVMRQASCRLPIPGILSISDFQSDFKVRHKKERKKIAFFQDQSQIFATF